MLSRSRRQLSLKAMSQIPRARVLQLAQHLGTSTTPAAPSSSVQQRRQSSTSGNSVKMSSQPDHPTLLIPGPIEFDDAVLQSMSHYR